MSQIIKHLSKFDDYELAFFAKFKLQTHLQETQKEINSFLAVRNITESRIEQLISTNPKSKLSDKKDRCWRCYSDKLRVHKVEWTDTANRLDYSDDIAAINGATGKPTFKEKVICDVCGQWNTDPNSERKKSFKEKTAEYFKAVIDGILHGL